MLSKKTKYGLKAMAYLARQESNKPVLIGQISDVESIPKKFLEAILLDLKKLGFVNSKQGKGGGYYLARPAEEISLASLIRVLEGPIALLPCVSKNYYEKCDDCPNEGVCQLNKVMTELRDSTLEILENKSLASLR
ncbi:MAG TPA: Rrf2 family transcriptional regulator [Faecalibacter sp.]